MKAPPKIHDLVRAFQNDQRTYNDGAYSEARVRAEYIDPFLEALDWHPGADPGHIEEWRDCIVEKSLEVEDETHKKRVDYTCRIGKTPVLFVEAKKPADDIFTFDKYARQIRSYAYSQGLHVGVLTNFRQLAVYDGRVRPKENDGFRVARKETIRYTEYVEKWDLICSLLSMEGIRSGAQREYMERSAAKGLIPVDQAILAEIERWREELAHAMARENPDLDAETLGFAVGRIIDRILFLRVCEARDMEPVGQLKGVCNGPGTYQRLLKLFHRTDKRYNSGLFYFKEQRGRAEKPDSLAERLNVDHRPLRQIIKGLYLPENQYEYSVIPVEILGQVYEQFLGKVIRLTEGHRAKVEDKPEVKKAGGVYYTPSYIVNYIVQHTVGRLVDGKTPKGIEKLRILDPACGSGSFLLGAYQYLLDWYLTQYKKDGPETHQKEICPDIYEGYRLTLRERRRILTDHIFGVDIDSQAVEVTKLSLLLKVLDGETHDTVESELKLGLQALPDLGKNIKCGNSLISTDFYKDHPDLSDHERRRINPFEWKKEFPTIFEDGGFDAVIGNPPWGASFSDAEKEYLKARFEHVHMRTPESFNYFIGRMWDTAGHAGIVGSIIPSSFLSQHEFSKTRKLLVDTASIHRICVLGDGVFSKVTAPSCISIFSGRYGDGQPLYLDLRNMGRAERPTALRHEIGARIVPAIGRDSESNSLQVGTGTAIVAKCNVWPSLRDIAEDVATGISSGADSVFVLDERRAKELDLERKLLRKIVIGKEIRRFSLEPTSCKLILYTTAQTNIDEFPNSKKALLIHRKRLLKRVEVAAGMIPWYSLYRPRRQKLFDQPKILIRQTADCIMAAFDNEKWYCLKSAIIVQLSTTGQLTHEYLIGLLNSRLMNLIYQNLVGEHARTFPEVKPVQLFKLPIRTINFSNKADKARHDKMVKLVERMLELNRKLPKAKTPDEKTRLERQIAATDRQIDNLVYELYGLTEEEIKIVEGE